MSLLHFAVPIFFLIIGSRLLQVFAHALQAAEAGRLSLEDRIKELQAANVEVEQQVKRLKEALAEETKRRERAEQQMGDLDRGLTPATPWHASQCGRS